MRNLLKTRGRLLLVEPRGHVSERHFEAEIADAVKAGLKLVDRPANLRGHAAVLEKE